MKEIEHFRPMPEEDPNYILSQFLIRGSENNLLKINYQNFNEKEIRNNRLFAGELSYELLETPRIQHNIDRFITRSFESIYELATTNTESNISRTPAAFPLDSNLPRDSRQKTEPNVHRYFRSLMTGLQVRIQEGETWLRRPLVVGGNEITASNNRYGRVDFTPEGRTSLDPAKMTDSLTKGIQGLVEFLEAAENGEIELPEVLHGSTNINMALIAQRLGFNIVDGCRNAEGVIDKNEGSFTVVGKLADIRERVKKFQEEGRLVKLQQRKERKKGQRNPNLSSELGAQFT